VKTDRMCICFGFYGVVMEWLWYGSTCWFSIVGGFSKWRRLLFFVNGWIDACVLMLYR